MGATMSAEYLRSDSSCGDCPAAAATRRAFLRDVAVAVAGAVAFGAFAGPAFAESVSEGKPIARRGMLRTYAIPGADSIVVDVDSDVALARWQSRVYAFSLRCPHRGTRLEWHADEARMFCPKHKARFRPDGAHDSGRASRDLDRFAIQRQNGVVVVDLDTLYRADRDNAWRDAVIVL
jgi:nitrite reductase/ring-hydroxylating ferredoxin subunit